LDRSNLSRHLSVSQNVGSELDKIQKKDYKKGDYALCQTNYRYITEILKFSNFFILIRQN